MKVALPGVEGAYENPNKLMKKHEKAFGEIKNYYNAITQDNLSLIKSLKEEVAEIEVFQRKASLSV